MDILIISKKHICSSISKFNTKIKEILTNSLIEFKNIKSKIYKNMKSKIFAKLLRFKNKKDTILNSNGIVGLITRLIINYYLEYLIFKIL